MQMLYDSDGFVVVHINANDETSPVTRDGFEIVDKHRNTFIYLDGQWAEGFQRHIKAWQDKTPEREEVEEVLASYSQLAHYPLVMH